MGDFPGQRPNRGFVRAIERGRHAQFVIAQVTGKTQASAYSGMLHKRECFIHQPSFTARNNELRTQRCLPQNPIERFQKRQQILAWFECADEKQKIIFDSQPSPRLHGLF